MKCDQVHEAFLEYFDNKLDGNQKSTFEEHLSNCKNCNENFEALKVYRSSVNKLDKVQAPTILKEKIILELNASEKKVSGNGKPLKLIGFISGVAAAILILFYFVAPGSFFKPASFEIIYVERIEKIEKGNEKSSAVIANKKEAVKRKIQEIKFLVDSFGGTITMETKDTLTGEPNFIQFQILKRKYPEFVKQFNKFTPHVSLPEDIPFSISRNCIIKIAIK